MSQRKDKSFFQIKPIIVMQLQDIQCNKEAMLSHAFICYMEIIVITLKASQDVSILNKRSDVLLDVFFCHIFLLCYKFEMSKLTCFLGSASWNLVAFKKLFNELNKTLSNIFG